MLLQWCDVMQRRNVAPWWRLPGRHSWRFPSADPLPEPTFPELQAEWQAAGMGAVTSPLSEAQGSTRHSQIQELKQHIRICDLQILRCKPSPDTCATVQICEGDKCMQMQAWNVRSVYNVYIHTYTYIYLHGTPPKKKTTFWLHLLVFTVFFAICWGIMSKPILKKF